MMLLILVVVVVVLLVVIAAARWRVQQDGPEGAKAGDFRPR